MCAWLFFLPYLLAYQKRNPRPMTHNYPQTGVLAPASEKTLLITHVRPYGEEEVDILIKNGVIEEISPAGSINPADNNVDTHIDGQGHILLPGLVDMHVHLREPGREDTETIETGSKAAAKGGFTAVFTMANTIPVLDQPVLAEAVWIKGQNIGLCDVHPVGSITKGLAGKEITEFGMMAQSAAKVRMFSDDGKCVNDPLIMRRAIEYSRGQDVLLAQHCEDHRLTEGASAHEGPTAARLGLRGWPRVAEESIVARDAILARDYGGRIHICHASTKGTVELLRWAKSQNIPLTAEVAPHHLILDDSRLATYDAVNKVNPPLREKTDTEAMQEALLEGIIDVVATDHAPHGSEDKCVEFDHALPGMLGLETSLAIIADTFVRTGRADWRFVARVMSERPAEITRLPGHGRPIAVGEPANLCVVDPDSSWVVNKDEVESKASNTPYEGMQFNTRVTHTILRGHVTYAQ